MSNSSPFGSLLSSLSSGAPQSQRNEIDVDIRLYEGANDCKLIFINIISIPKASDFPLFLIPKSHASQLCLECSKISCRVACTSDINLEMALSNVVKPNATVAASWICQGVIAHSKSESGAPHGFDRAT